jgi:hypothetical protein
MIRIGAASSICGGRRCIAAPAHLFLGAAAFFHQIATT